MRAGLRRLRSAFDLFEGVITAPLLSRRTAVDRGRTRCCTRLGSTGSLTLPAGLDGAPVDIYADAVTQAAREMAKQNRTRAAAAVDSVRYTRLITELTRWIDQAAWREGLE